MSPEVKAAIIQVAGEWAILSVKTHPPKYMKTLLKRLLDDFETVYNALQVRFIGEEG